MAAPDAESAASRETTQVSEAATTEGDPGTQPEPSGAPTTEADETVQGAQPAVLSDGTVVVAYLDTMLDGVQKGLATVMVAMSSDGGKTFSEPVQAGVFREIHFMRTQRPRRIERGAYEVTKAQPLTHELGKTSSMSTPEARARDLMA